MIDSNQMLSGTTSSPPRLDKLARGNCKLASLGDCSGTKNEPLNMTLYVLEHIFKSHTPNGSLAYADDASYQGRVVLGWNSNPQNQGHIRCKRGCRAGDYTARSVALVAQEWFYSITLDCPGRRAPSCEGGLAGLTLNSHDSQQAAVVCTTIQA
jgi:hypothetical protein